MCDLRETQYHLFTYFLHLVHISNVLKRNQREEIGKNPKSYFVTMDRFHHFLKSLPLFTEEETHSAVLAFLLPLGRGGQFSWGLFSLQSKYFQMKRIRTGLVLFPVSWGFLGVWSALHLQLDFFLLLFFSVTILQTNVLICNFYFMQMM